MATLADLKAATVDAFTQADANLDRAAAVAQQAADYIKGIQNPGENPMVQEMIDLMTTDGAEILARGDKITDTLAAALPHVEPPPPAP